MKDIEFVSTIAQVSFLVKETFELDNVLKPEEFYDLWERNKHKLGIDSRIKNSQEGKLCFYNHYLMFNLLQSASTHVMPQYANDRALRIVQ